MSNTSTTGNKYAIAMIPCAEDQEKVRRWFEGGAQRVYLYSSRGSGGFCKELCDAALFVQHKTALKTARELAQHYCADTRFEVVTVAFAEASAELVEVPDPDGFAVMILEAAHHYTKLPCFIRRDRWVRNFKTAQVFKTQAAAQEEINGIVAELKKAADEEVERNEQAEAEAARRGRAPDYRRYPNEPSTHCRESAAAFRAEVVKLTASGVQRLEGAQ